MGVTKRSSKGGTSGSGLCLMLMFVWFFLASRASCCASTVTLRWDPVAGSDLAGYKVYYKPDSPALPLDGAGALQGASPLDVASQTATTLTGLDPARAYYFAVTAYNSAGIESPYSNFVLIPELIPPTVSISSPDKNATVSGTVSVSASASDNVGVTRVDFLLNGALQVSDPAAPYLFSWNTASYPPGVYTLSARAYDAAGNLGQSSDVPVTLVHDTSAPTVSLTSPADKATLSGVVAITASASDNVGVTRVEFYGNGVLLFAGGQAPYAFNWNTSSSGNGPYTLSARAYDAAGNLGQSSDLTVTVQNGAGPTPGPLTLLDAQLALSIASGLATPTSADLLRLDLAPYINGQSSPNGKIDTGDVVVILAKLVGKL